jgi:hypothetical protein
MRGPRMRHRLIAVIGAALTLLASSSVLSSATILQQGNLRVSIHTQVSPFKLPRTGTAPIRFFVSAHVSAVHGGTPPQLRSIDIKVNRAAHLGFQGFPVCHLAAIQPSTGPRALRSCGHAAIGGGHFWLNVVFPEQGSYPTQGHLLLFNGRYHRHPAILAHVFTSNPFPASFVLVFRQRRLSTGTYGSEFSAALPQAFGDWGYVDRLKMTLHGSRRGGGTDGSFFNAGCPAPEGVRVISYHLAFATLTFAGYHLAARIDKTCEVRE